ncbi:MAG: hypothetical protein P1V18_04060, partial [Candidatus Gracilibacteria bacterium]|nr:hypothetical protein [Candidatus Gracilibacteria bacterium]
QRQQTIDNSAVLTCATCVNGVDLSQYEWSKSPLVKIENGKFYIGGQDNSVQVVREGNTSNLDSAVEKNIIKDIESTEFLQKIENAPNTEKHNIDKNYPEYWARIIGIHGGKQVFDMYKSGGEYSIKSKDSISIANPDCDCQFESDVVSVYNGKDYEDDFVDWRTTNKGKEVLYEEILINIRRKEKGI